MANTHGIITQAGGVGFDTEWTILCDDNGPFLRRYAADSDNAVTPTDTALDGVTAYTPVGNVVLCNNCRETYDETAGGVLVNNATFTLPADVGSFTVSAQEGVFDISFDGGTTWITGRVGTRTFGQGNSKMVANSEQVMVRSPSTDDDVDVIWEILQVSLCGVENVNGAHLSNGVFNVPAGVLSLTVSAQTGSFDVSFDGGATWPLTGRIGDRTWGNGNQFVVSNSANMAIRSNSAADDIDIMWEA